MINHQETPPIKPKKKWSEIHAENSWTMFKVIAEFVEGFERLNQIGPCISIFGSARTKPGEPYYELAADIAKRLTEEGYGIITGGGPGIMEAGNRGAKEANGISVGLNIDLPFEQGFNPFIDTDKNFNFDYFFIRKVMFVKYAQAFIVLPGGFGTMDEMFEVLTLIQTKKIDRIPIVLVGKDFWSGLLDWIVDVMLKTHGNISAEDLQLMPVIDSVEEIVQYINSFYANSSLRPNYRME